MPPEKGFWFDSETHTYWFNQKKMSGTTTILSVISKPQLIQWAANEAIKSLKEGTVKDENGLYHFNEEHLEKARTAHAQKKDKAADIGTLAHQWCERWIKGENPKRDEALAIITDNFVKWATENKVNFLTTEKIVYSEKYFYGGTLDFIAEINGKIFLGDIKTSSGIYPEMFYQTAAYQNALYECEPSAQLIDSHIIVNCTKDGKLNIEKSNEYEANRQAFMGALAIYRRLQQTK